MPARRAIGGGLLFAVLAVVLPACSSRSGAPDPPPESLGPCTGLGPAPTGYQITVTRGRKLVSVRTDGTQSCLLDDVDPGELAWGPRGDRVLLGTSRVVFDDRTVPVTISTPASVALSAPKGTTAVGVSSDGHLFRQTLNGNAPEDISFLARHDEVVYHPAGTKIVTSGQGHDGTYGIWIASNTGANHTLFVKGETADRIHDLAFIDQGTLLAFVADHGPGSHVHLYGLGYGGVATAAESGSRFVHVAARHGGRFAVQEGDCGGTTSTRIFGGGPPTPVAGQLAGRSTTPVGWLPEGTLVLLARERGCTGPAELWTWKDGVDHLVTTGVDHVAIRDIDPEVEDLPLDQIGRAPT